MELHRSQNSVHGNAWRVLFRKQFNKTKMCGFYNAGECKYGDNCTYAHDANDLQVAPDLAKTTMCQDWQRGCCQKQAEDCPFAHGSEELQVTPAFASSFLRKRSQKIAQKHVQSQQQQDDNGSSRTENGNSGSDSHDNGYGGSARVGTENPINRHTITSGGIKMKKRKNKNAEVSALHNSFVNSQCQVADQFGELFRSTMNNGAKGLSGLPNASTIHPTLLHTFAGGCVPQAPMQPVQSANGQYITCRSKQVGAGLTDDDALHRREMCAAPVVAAEPQNLAWQLQMRPPYMGVDSVPQQVSLLDLLGAPGTAVPPAAPHQFMMLSPSAGAQQLAAQRLQQAPIQKPAMGAILSEKTEQPMEERPHREAEHVHIQSYELNSVPRCSPASSCSANSESLVSEECPDSQSPIHRWGRDPSTEFQVRVGHSSAAYRGVGTPSSSASPERESPMRGWARTPSTIASPDLSPMKATGRISGYPMPVDMPSLSSIFNSSGQQGRDDEGFMLCRNNRSSWPCV